MEVRHRSLGLATRKGSLPDPAARTVEVIFTTGAAVARRDWWTGERYLEELSLESDHVRLRRLQNGAPLLAVHDTVRLDAVIGVTETAAVGKNGGTATVRFAQTPEGDKALQMVRDGILRNVSVGYIVHRYQKTEGNDGALATWRAIDWEPVEISLVPVPADPGAQVRSADIEWAIDDEQPKGRQVSEQADKQRLSNERERILGIMDRAKRHNLSDSFARSLVDSELSLDEACARMVDEVARLHAPKNPINPARTGDRGENERAEEALRHMTSMVVERAGGAKAPDAARDRYGRTSILQMARELLEERGINTARMSRDELITRSHTTSDLPNLLTGAGDRMLRAAYEAAPSVKKIARKRLADDFRSISNLAFGEAPALRKKLESGEFKRGALSEGKETYALETAGAIVTVSREALINDDLNAFGTLARRMGVASAEYENQTLVNILIANANLGDGVALFHSTHGNQSAAPAAISDVTLGDAKLAMRKQKGIDGKTPINCLPKFLLVPAAIEITALKYLATYAPATAATVNPFAGTLDLIVDPRLDVDSASKWYLAADPDLFDGLEYAYLSDAQGPQLAANEDFNTAAYEWRVMLDFAAKAIDFRGLYRNS